MAELKKSPGPERSTIRRKLFARAILVLCFVILVIVGIQGWEWSNSTAFCTQFCHGVHLEELVAYQDSYHVRVECVECHIGQESMLRNIVLKTGHLKSLPSVLFGQYDHPLEAKSLRPTNESCERCHWPPTFHGDRLLQIKHFRPDEYNTEEHIYLALKTGGGERETGLGYGIHWHIENQVEYIATDERNQDIRWVRATLPDGHMVEYNDVTAPLSGDEIAQADKQVMDCVDCHNRMGHPFLSPDWTIDKALAEGRLDRDLPFIKQELMNFFTTTYPDQETALDAVESVEARYRSVYPEVIAIQAAAVKQATEVAQELATVLVFDEPGITWQSFPNNGEHKEFPGCFRCHNGKQQSSDGESIRLGCNICHSIPVVTSAQEPLSEITISLIQEPASHQEANFIASHRILASDDCTVCHGDIAFGSDDSSFCANSACHGQAWSSVDLAAAFPHPSPLEGKHTAVGCDGCHAGVEQLSYRCANCHQPPADSHFGPDCEDCHTPDGFASATPPEDFGLPMQLEGAHTELECSACHVPSQGLEVKCANCHQPPSGPPFGPTHLGQDCENCHELTGFKGATLPPERHPVPLVGNHQRVSCGACHSESQPVPEYACENCHQPPDVHLEVRETCATCHNPEGWVESVTSILPQMPHPSDGREECLLCHDAGGVRPVPATHQGRVNEDCARCHQLDSVAVQVPSIPHVLEGRDDCLACHAEGGLKPVTASHEGRSNEDCQLCHAASGEAPSTSTPGIPHTLEGRDDCLLCHAEGGLKPVPVDHEGRSSDDCQLCHAASVEAPSTSTPGIPHTLEGRDDCLLCHAEGGLKPVPDDHEGRSSGDCQLCHAASDEVPSTSTPGIPHTLEGRDDCLLCHAEGGLKPVPTDHEGRSSGDCQLCHEPSSDATSTPSPGIPHTLEGRDECLVCHAEGGLKPVPTGHKGRSNEDCQLCHAVSDEAASTPTPDIPHTLEGRDDCVMCHDPSGQIKPAPIDHTDRTKEQCVLCHQSGS